jgi:hypothetical protein
MSDKRITKTFPKPTWCADVQPLQRAGMRQASRQKHAK